MDKYTSLKSTKPGFNSSSAALKIGGLDQETGLSEPFFPHLSGGCHNNNT